MNGGSTGSTSGLCSTFSRDLCRIFAAVLSDLARFIGFSRQFRCRDLAAGQLERMEKHRRRDAFTCRSASPIYCRFGGWRRLCGRHAAGVSRIRLVAPCFLTQFLASFPVSVDTRRSVQTTESVEILTGWTLTAVAGDYNHVAWNDVDNSDGLEVTANSWACGRENLAIQSPGKSI